MITVFSLLSKLKNIPKQKYIITEYDIDIMKSFHMKLKGIISFKLWKKIVIEYAIGTNTDIYDACDELVDQIYDEYKKK